MTKMTRTNYFPKNTPQAYIDFVDFLVSTYPLRNTSHLIWEFTNRPEVAHKAWGINYNATYDGQKCTTCNVAMGSLKMPRPIEKVLHTIAHEYRHAMQYDIGLEGDCTEADKFADKVAKAYIWLDPTGEVEKAIASAAGTAQTAPEMQGRGL